MTREKAILCLKGIKNYGRDTFTEQSDWQNSLDMAIKALEQESCDKYIKEIDYLHKYISKLETQIVEQKPCDDTVSREDAKSFLYERLNRLNNDELYDIFSVIIDDMYNELPPVKPISR